MARLSSSSSMAKSFSIRGHETRIYLCACHLGFWFNKFINTCKKIRLQPFNQEVLQKNTYNSSRNNHANPSCNTFLQEKHQRMPKISSFNKCAFLKSANNSNRAQISDLTMSEWICDDKNESENPQYIVYQWPNLLFRSWKGRQGHNTKIILFLH